MIAAKQVDYLGVICRRRRAAIKRMEHDLPSFQTIDVGATVSRSLVGGSRPAPTLAMPNSCSLALKSEPSLARRWSSNETTLSWRQRAQFENVSDLIKSKFVEMGYIDNTKTVSQRVDGDAWFPQGLSLFKQADFERTNLIVRPVGQDAHGCR